MRLVADLCRATSYFLKIAPEAVSYTHLDVYKRQEGDAKDQMEQYIHENGMRNIRFCGFEQDLSKIYLSEMCIRDRL